MSSLVRVGSGFGYFDLESSRISSGSGSGRIGFRSLLGSDWVWISLTFWKNHIKSNLNSDGSDGFFRLDQILSPLIQSYISTCVMLMRCACLNKIKAAPVYKITPCSTIVFSLCLYDKNISRYSCQYLFLINLFFLQNWVGKIGTDREAASGVLAPATWFKSNWHLLGTLEKKWELYEIGSRISSKNTILFE
jgi:hypothetical protein